MTQPKISVIVPVFNGGRYLKECLNSISSQTLTPHEIIIIDDDSTDNSQTIAHEFPAFRYYKQQHAGVAAARNLGIEKSSGDWIAFIDQDDYWCPESLEYRLLHAFTDPAFQIIIGKQQLFLDGLGTAPSWLKPELLDRAIDGYLLGCALIQKKLFYEKGMFDSNLRFSSDYDWFFRIKDAGISFQSIDRLVLYKRIHSNNESRHSQALFKELSWALLASIKRKRNPAISQLKDPE